MLCENGELIDVPLGQRFVCKLGADETFKPEPCKHIKWCAIKHAYEMLPGYENKCENISS
jgi:cupin superfamily acireductone dioxygenase involved in methionine salvage